MVTTDENGFPFLPGNNKPKLKQIWIKVEGDGEMFCVQILKCRLNVQKWVIQKLISEDLALIPHGL